MDNTSNKVLAYNKEITYSVLQVDNRKIIVAEKLINSVVENCKISDIKLKSFQGDLVQKHNMFTSFKNSDIIFDVPMFEANFVTLDQVLELFIALQVMDQMTLICA